MYPVYFVDLLCPVLLLGGKHVTRAGEGHIERYLCYKNCRGRSRRQFCEMRSSLWLRGLGLLAVPSVSQAFVPSTAARAAAAAAATGQQQQRLHQQQRSCVGLAATRRDVVRMPSSEPMVRDEERFELQQARCCTYTSTLCAVGALLCTAVCGRVHQQQC